MVNKMARRSGGEDLRQGGCAAWAAFEQSQDMEHVARRAVKAVRREPPAPQTVARPTSPASRTRTSWSGCMRWRRHRPRASAIVCRGAGGKRGEAGGRFCCAPSSARSLPAIVSDGFDTGPADRLAAELARLKRRTRRLVWLTPLLGRKSYEPRAAGMSAALPHIDLLAPAHNLESLAALERELARL